MLKVLFNKHNIVYSIAMLILAATGAAGLTVSNADTFFATGAATKATLQGLGGFVVWTIANQMKDGTLIAQLTANGKLSWNSVFNWVRVTLVAGGVSVGFLDSNALTNIHAISWVTVLFAVISSAKTLYTHYQAAAAQVTASDVAKAIDTTVVNAAPIAKAITNATSASL